MLKNEIIPYDYDYHNSDYVDEVGEVQAEHDDSMALMKGRTATLTKINFISDIPDGPYEDDNEKLIIARNLISAHEEKILKEWYMGTKKVEILYYLFIGKI
ncbi:hypothetical protein [Secundilactobacillus paracollinoides]|uniref:Uncharacterized protein n=1 Tax=Secundilactobacillus paracollinoides TaxID=240427 RepID=A0A1B2IYA4_9LACO|nr:hypothetical protein [Secundilactobacillus paracollinoides]ANZ61090.1 hypothetical protein AYR61_06870 [Secundilactobacillus paracollinoides]ANZ67013.1 hypothetical protein AYR63_07625 [Secundilactobacillus paracollinoides]